MPPASSADPRPKWRKRKRPKKRDDEDEEEEEEENEDGEPEDVVSDPNNADRDPILGLRQSEVLSDPVQRLCDFPLAFRRSVNRPHPSVVGLVAAERFSAVGSVPSLENISHGQLHPLSGVAREDLGVLEQDNERVHVCVPPVLMEGEGVEKKVGDGRVHVVPVHSGN